MAESEAVGESMAARSRSRLTPITEGWVAEIGSACVACSWLWVNNAMAVALATSPVTAIGASDFFTNPRLALLGRVIGLASITSSAAAARLALTIATPFLRKIRRFLRLRCYLAFANPKPEKTLTISERMIALGGNITQREPLRYL